MRVLISQQFHPAERYQYVRHLLPGLLEITPDVVVGVTEEGMASVEFASLLSPFSDRVRFDASLPSGHDRVIRGERWKICTDLRNLVRRVRPDYVLVPDANPYTTVTGFFRVAGLGSMPRHCPVEIGIHFGRGAGAVGEREIRRDRIDRLKLAAGGWTRVHIVNLLFYEYVRAAGGALARRACLLPHPVLANPRLGKIESRQRLGLPDHGRLIGVTGVIDHRKAIAELLSAFRAASQEPSDRVLLAGALSPVQRTLIQSQYQDLVDAGRLIVWDRYLGYETYQTVLTALDVPCIPYPGFASLSGVLLEGIAAGRPVLSHNQGWCDAIVKRFHLGWTCDVLNHDAFSHAIRTALDACESYVQSEATNRLLQFHSPDNFVESWLEGVRALAGAKSSQPFLSWNWVLEGLEDRRG